VRRQLYEATERRVHCVPPWDWTVSFLVPLVQSANGWMAGGTQGRCASVCWGCAYQVVRDAEQQAGYGDELGCRQARGECARDGGRDGRTTDATVANRWRTVWWPRETLQRVGQQMSTALRGGEMMLCSADA
jgi:hypothetical protein